MQHQQLSTACSTGFDLASTSAACTASAISTDLASAACAASFAAALAGMPSSLRALSAGSAPLSSAAARAAHPRVGDLGVVEVERVELLQPSSRRRQRTCRRRRRHEGGEALVAERAVPEIETNQRGQPP